MSSIYSIIRTDLVDQGKKSAEEDIIANLGVIHACCRGAADVLGDTITPQTLPSNTNEFDDEVEEGRISKVINTGVNSLFSECDTETISFFLQMRERVVAFLISIHDSLNQEMENLFLDQTVCGIGKESSAVNVSGCTFTPDICALWLRVYEAIMIHRGWLKEAMLCKHSFSANKRQTVNSTARYTKRLIERFGKSCSPESDLANSLYWERYDLPPFSSSDRGMIQFGLFTKENAHSSIRAKVHSSPSKEDHIFTSSLNRVVMLCANEFDSVRADSLHYFNKVSYLRCLQYVSVVMFWN